MWVKREVWDSVGKQVARLEAQVELKKERISSLEREVDYWRGKFEESLHRADRVTDQMLQTSGLNPVTDLGIRESEMIKKDYARMVEEMRKQNQEMFGDDDVSEETTIDTGLAQALLQQGSN